MDCQLIILGRDIGSHSAAQGKETHALLEDAVTVQTSHQVHAEILLTGTQASLATVVRQNDALLALAVDPLLAIDDYRRRTENSVYLPCLSLIPIDRQGEIILDKTIEKTPTDHNTFRDIEGTVKDSTLLAGHLSKQNHTVNSLQLQRMSKQVNLSSVNKRVNAVYDDSGDIRKIEIDLHSFTDIQLFALYLLIRQGIGFIQNLLQVYPQLLLLLGSFTMVPASISNLRGGRGRSLQRWILRRLTGSYESAPRSKYAPQCLAE